MGLFDDTIYGFHAAVLVPEGVLGYLRKRRGRAKSFLYC